MENSKEKQIEELLNELIRTNGYGTLNAVANHLYNTGYRKQSKGEWIEKGECWKTLQCSVCGHTTDTIFDRTPYCPNCGAKMKGGAE